MTIEQEEILELLSARIQRCWNALEEKGFITNELINKQLEELTARVKKLEEYTQQTQDEYIRHHRSARQRRY